jgi:protein SSD1
MNPQSDLERQQQQALQYRAEVEEQIRQQQEAAQRVLLEHQITMQRLQAQALAAQQQQQRQQNLPPRFMNQQRHSGGMQPSTLYEEEPNLEGLPPFALGQGRRPSNASATGPDGFNADYRMRSPPVQSQQLPFVGADSGAGLGMNAAGGGGSVAGINAGMLAGIAARAHRRTGSEMTPFMAEQVCIRLPHRTILSTESSSQIPFQLALQQQIEALQMQQQLLLHQANYSQPNTLSNLSNVLLAQQRQQLHEQQQQQLAQAQAQIEAQQRQQIERERQQAESQAERDSSRQQALSSITNAAHRRSQSHSQPAGPSLNDFVLPTFGNSSGKNAQYNGSNTGQPNVPGRKMSDMGPPPVPVPVPGHNRRGSIQTHRPSNSIIGSFGGFVNDMPDDVIQGNMSGGHHRTGSRSATDGNWRMSELPCDT